MKKIFFILVNIFSLILICSNIAYSNEIGEGNIDGGGGGMNDGSEKSFWSVGNEGVRVTIVSADDNKPVTVPIDYANKSISSVYHFGKMCKISYNTNPKLNLVTKSYNCINPSQPLPQIVSWEEGNGNIDSIRNYFTDEQIIKGIAKDVGMKFDNLIGGDYRILIEPLAYFKFDYLDYAMTATEAALYDRQLNGYLYHEMYPLTHQNLPLSMYLEVSDLGYPAWKGTTTRPVSIDDIISSLGLGIVRFKELPLEPPEVETYDYEYRVDTDVITSVSVSGGESNPDNPTSVEFEIQGRKYIVNNVYYPSGSSQLAWVKWHTPKEPQEINVTVKVNGKKDTIKVNIISLEGNDPPDPQPDDKNDSFIFPSLPQAPQKNTATWSIWRPWWHENWVWVADWVWHSRGCKKSCPDDCDKDHGKWVDEGEYEDHGWWEYDLDTYEANLTATMKIKPDEKVPTNKENEIKSGYGVNNLVTAVVTTNQSSAVTSAQNAVSYFPEFKYEKYWRLLELTKKSGYNSEFKFMENKYSTYNQRVHFTPIWYPNGDYILYTYVLDVWTPMGMLSADLNYKVEIMGSLWDDWHIAPQE